MRLLTEDMVNIFIRPKRKRFHLHTDLLCDRSEFFRKVLSKGFKEQDDKAVYLSEEDVGAFKLFVRWTCGAQLPLPTTAESLTRRLVLYVMAEEFCIEALKNDLMNKIRSHYCYHYLVVPSQQIDYIYQNTLTNCPMRLVLAHTAVRAFLMPGKEELPVGSLGLISKGGDFAADFTVALFRSKVNDDKFNPYAVHDCAYHERRFSEVCSFPIHSELDPSELPATTSELTATKSSMLLVLENQYQPHRRAVLSDSVYIEHHSQPTTTFE